MGDGVPQCTSNQPAQRFQPLRNNCCAASTNRLANAMLRRWFCITQRHVSRRFARERLRAVRRFLPSLSIPPPDGGRRSERGCRVVPAPPLLLHLLLGRQVRLGWGLALV